MCRGKARYTLVLLAAGLLLASCNPLGDKGAVELLTGAEQSLAAIGHPSPRDLAATGAVPEPHVSPWQCATGEDEQPLRSETAADTEDGLRLVSGEQEMAWAIYAAGGLDDGLRPAALELSFAAREGTLWLGLADFARSSWEWQQLPEGAQVDLGIDSDLTLAEGNALYFTLAVYSGDSATFSGGEITADDNPQPEPEPEPEPEEPAGPEIVGAYISLGYWDEDKINATFAALADAGVNFVIDYALIAPEDEYWQAGFQRYLNAAAYHGVGVAFWLKDTLEGMTPLTPGDHLTDTAAQVAALRNHPAITAWYVHDEILPSIAGEAGTTRYSLSLEQMQQLYDLIHAEDPDRPQISVWHTLPSFELFNLIYTEQYTPYGRPDWMLSEAAYEQALSDMLKKTCDWVIIDSYPVGAPWRDGGSPPPELDVMALAQRAATLSGPAQPLVFIFQAFSWAQYDPVNAAGAPFPTRDELDRMLCGAYTFGADSVIAYSWFDLLDDLPGRDIDGREAALSNLLDLLDALNTTGWPEAELAMGAAPVYLPVKPPLPLEPISQP